MPREALKPPPTAWAKGPHIKEIRQLNAQLGGELGADGGEVLLRVGVVGAQAERALDNGRAESGTPGAPESAPQLRVAPIPP